LIKGDIGIVWSLASHDDLLFSGHQFGFLVKWSISFGNMIAKMKGTQLFLNIIVSNQEVYCIAPYNNVLLLGSVSLHVYDMATFASAGKFLGLLFQ
jgi:hypothetical protein